MSPGAGPTADPDADFVYDYETLRIGGLVFAGIIVLLSVFLLTGNRLRRCGKPKESQGMKKTDGTHLVDDLEM